MAMFEQKSCGCPVETSRYPYRCCSHIAPGRMVTESHRGKSAWYFANTCPFCGRVNPAGLCCSHEETCETCGLRSCDSHRMGTYRLGIICPKEVNPRTKAGRTLLRSLAAFAA